MSPDVKSQKPTTEAPRWLDNPHNVTNIVRGLIAVCAVLVLADLAYHKHVHYGFEGWWGFYGFYGFVSCVLLVRAAVVLRKLVMRPEDYYEPVDDAAAAASPQPPPPQSPAPQPAPRSRRGSRRG